MNTRTSHWISRNKQERMPSRMIVFDTESINRDSDSGQVQEWRCGAVVRWRTDLKSGDRAERAVFDDAMAMWQYIAEYCVKDRRTVVWAHNLSYDIRISKVFTILPLLGFRLEWCNLDRNVSSMTWRSDRGSLVFADTWTWIPLKLATVAEYAGTKKWTMPRQDSSNDKWQEYCAQDAEILYLIVKDLTGFIRSAALGNWQPTGAGMAYTTWRHKFMTHKVLVHDDMEAITAERCAMHCGRAEAWKHGSIIDQDWIEVDFRNAYLVIAAETQLPRKIHMRHGRITIAQFRSLNERFAVLCKADIETTVPSIPYYTGKRTLWPTGKFSGWYWDCEIDMAMRYGAKVSITDSYCYIRAPILANWAMWVMQNLRNNDDNLSPAVLTYLKHSSRALIGRLSLRTPTWEAFGSNPEGHTGITHVVIPGSNLTTRMMHVGNDTFIETARHESRDSLPQITGYIMAECRTRLFDAMNMAGLENIAHVDTDSILLNRNGLSNLRNGYGGNFDYYWQIKGAFKRLEIWGPRAYYRDRSRVFAGIPKNAIQIAPGRFAGEKWSTISTDMEDSSAQVVTVKPASYSVQKLDPRRDDAPGVTGETVAYCFTGVISPKMSSPTDARDGL